MLVVVVVVVAAPLTYTTSCRVALVSGSVEAVYVSMITIGGGGDRDNDVDGGDGDGDVWRCLMRVVGDDDGDSE